MRMVLLAVALASLGARPAEVSVEAAWRIAGVSKDQRSIRVIHTGRCRGRSSVVPLRRTVRIAVAVSEPCAHETGFSTLRVPLGERLNGRRAVGRPQLEGNFPTTRMPRVVGLHRHDAMRALAGRGIRVRATSRIPGKVSFQLPRAGRRISSNTRARIVVARAARRARLHIDALAGQTPRSVARRGLRFAFRVNPDVERGLDARLTCDGQDAGVMGWPVRRAVGRRSVQVNNLRVLRALRRGGRFRCTLNVASFPRRPRNPNDYLRLRKDVVVLRQRA